MGAISAIQAASAPVTGDDETLPTHSGHRHGHAGVASRMTTGKMGFLMKLMGLDRFAQKKDREGLVRLGKLEGKNPFDLGCIGNCRDFWTAGREVGNWFQLYPCY